MKDRKYYWTMKNGEKIDVDEMSEDHLRNVLKLIIRRVEAKEKSYNSLEPYAYDYLWK